MIQNSQEISKKINNMGEIIKAGLENPVVKHFCTQGKNQSYEEVKKIQNEFSRFVGYCILFKNSQDIEKYMMIRNQDEQIKFLKDMISKKLEIPEDEINYRKKEIVEYAFQNFKKNGYVFHAANSSSIKFKMVNGLNDNNASIEQKNELIYIESLYRKYAPDSPYSPLGHGATDILDNKTGWFFDGLPIHSTGYANSPQWFNYLCGKSYVYFDSIPEEKRNGYANRDYETSLEAVIWLIKNRQMSLEDRKEILYFFEKCWNEYKDTTPCLMFVPAKEVGINSEIKLEEYLSDEGIDLLFKDIISGKVNPIKNCCCKKSIPPEKLSYVDLSSIIPKFKIERENKKTNKVMNSSNHIQTQDDWER